MAILDLQRRMRELGRIRIGQTVPGKNGRRRPEKLETFRLTSASRELLDVAAAEFGGEVTPWQSPAGQQFELVTDTDTLDIVIPPSQSFSQWNELWTGGGCQRRCDGRWNVISDSACACPEDRAERRDLAAQGQACKPTTRLNVMLPVVPDLGVWRLETHGFYAAQELGGTVDVITMATETGRMVRARLRLDQREQKRPGEPVKRFAVPVIELPGTFMRDLIGDGAPVASLPARVDRSERVPRPELPSGPPLPAEAAPFSGEDEPPLPGVEGLSRDQFLEFLQGSTWSARRIEEIAAEMFPDELGRGEPLNDHQRWLLRDELTKRGSEAPADVAGAADVESGSLGLTDSEDER